MTRMARSIGNSRCKAITLRAMACVLLLACASVPAVAQDSFVLTQDQWQQQAQLDPASPEGKLQSIRKLLAQDEFTKARKQAKRWIKAYPNHPQLVEAHMLHGDARVGNRDYYKALYDYEYVIRTYPASEQFQTAMEREFEIARLFTGGMKRRLWGIRMLPAQGEGEELFIRIQERSPGSELGEKASLALGDYYFAESRMHEAATAYDLFLMNYPRSEHREGVLLRMIQASLATFKGPEFDSKGLMDAAERLRQYKREYPAAAERIGADAILVRIDESLALKSYTTGQWFENRGKRVSAVLLYQRVVRDHPQTASARNALAKLQSMGVLGTVAPQADPQADQPAPTQEHVN